MFVINNESHATQKSATLRVKGLEIREHKITMPHPCPCRDTDEHITEVNYVKAAGRIFIDHAYRNDAVTCETLPDHRHCTRDLPGHQHMKTVGSCPDGPAALDHSHDMVPAEHACCLIPVDYPISLHFELPIGDPMLPAFGDTITVTVQRADYAFETVNGAFETVNGAPTVTVNLPGSRVVANTGITVAV
jgi:hypothetical protein